MKKVSCKMFFTVVWRGICQVLGWFFGLFGYKRDGKFAKCVWGLFAVSASIVMAILAITASTEFYDHVKRQRYWDNYCEINGGQFVSELIGYVNDFDAEGEGYLINKKTGKKVLKNIEWIATPLGNDSLVCFSSNKHRGYFNANDGTVIVEPKYEHAWIFSDGVAAVEEDGKIKFIDSTGKIVIDNGIKYDPERDGYVFHGGYLAVYSDENSKYGLMDTKGKMVLPIENDYVEISNSLTHWRVSKDGLWAVYDKNMNQIIPFMDGCPYIWDNTIDVTMSDNTLRKYDLSGNLINDFYVSNVRMLEYDTEEMYFVKSNSQENEDECSDELEPWQHKRAVAHLRSYEAGNGHEGLMTAEGHIVTMPLYENIEAISPDTYLCEVSNGDKVVVNGKGQVIR